MENLNVHLMVEFGRGLTELTAGIGVTRCQLRAAMLEHATALDATAREFKAACDELFNADPPKASDTLRPEEVKCTSENS